MRKLREDHERELTDAKARLGVVASQRTLSRTTNSLPPPSPLVSVGDMQLERALLARYPGTLLAAKFGGNFPDLMLAGDRHYFNRRLDLLKHVHAWLENTERFPHGRQVDELYSDLMRMTPPAQDWTPQLQKMHSAELQHFAEYCLGTN